MKTEDDIVACALIEQAMRAAAGDTELSVTTFITRPLWRIWCRWNGFPEECDPTEWLGLHKTRRVWGTRTIVIESDHLASVSFRTSSP